MFHSSNVLNNGQTRKFPNCTVKSFVGNFKCEGIGRKRSTAVIESKGASAARPLCAFLPDVQRQLKERA